MEAATKGERHDIFEEGWKIYFSLSCHFKAYVVLFFCLFLENKMGYHKRMLQINRTPIITPLLPEVFVFLVLGKVHACASHVDPTSCFPLVSIILEV